MSHFAPSTNTTKHTGSCHCGAVRYEVEIDLARVTRCNCSICTKISSLGCLVKPSQFRVLAGEESIGSYSWATKTAARCFCKTCGVHCFGRGYVEEIGGDFVSINANTLDDVDPNLLPAMHWDGRHDNWMAGPRPTPFPIFA